MHDSKGWSACLLASHLRVFTCNATVSSKFLAHPGFNLRIFYSRLDGPFARCYCLVADNTSPKMVFMTTLSSWRAEYKRTHPSSSTNAPEEPDVPDKSGSGIPPWRDKSIQDKIPDVFTIDVDSAVSAESLELAAVVCTCEWCQNWMTTMRWTYCDPIFCITSTTNRGDFEFYKSIGVTRWPSDARYYPGFGTVCVSSDGILCMKSEGRLLQGKTCYEEDEEESVEREGPWFMVVCIGRRGQLGTYSPDNPRAAHILLPHDIIPRGQVIGDFYLFPNGFTIQAFSSGRYHASINIFWESSLTK